jgi:hypothetical protein
MVKAKTVADERCLTMKETEKIVVMLPILSQVIQRDAASPHVLSAAWPRITELEIMGSMRGYIHTPAPKLNPGPGAGAETWRFLGGRWGTWSDLPGAEELGNWKT